MTNKEFDIIINQKLQQYSSPVPASLWDKIAAKDLSEPSTAFDELIQGKLYHYTAPTPFHLWDKIKPAEKEDRRRIIAWLPKRYMSAAAILLFLFIGSIASYIYLLQQPIIPDQEEVKIAPIKEQVEESKQNLQSDKKESFVNSPIPEEKGSSRNSLIPEDQPAVTPSSSSKASSNQNNLVATTSTSKRFENKQMQRNSIKSLDDIVSLDEIESYEISEKANNSYIRQKRNLAALYNKELNKYNHASSFKNVVICPTDRKMRNPDWDLEVFISPDMPFKTVTNNTASTQLLNTKDSSESLRPGFTAGFRIVKPLNDHFAIKTGLQYSQINERFTYRTENETRTTTVVSIRAIIRAPGDTLLVRDTSTLTQIGFKTNSVKNRYRSLDIPILASYQVGNDDLRFGITAGAIINISSWYQGVILDSSLSAVALNKETNMVYKSNIGIGLFAGVSITKRISYATQLFFEPYLRYNLSNMTNPDASFNQRFSIGGLNMGLRFNLNKR